MLGLRFCARAFSSRGKRGPLFIAVRGPLTIAASLVAEHRPRCAGSAIVAHGPSRSAACGIFLDQGSNPCPLHWQADSQPLRHQGSPEYTHFKPLLLLIKTLFHKLICFLNLVFKETSREEIFSHFTFGHYIEEIPSRIVFLVWGEFFGFVFFWQGWWGGQERSIQAKLK